MPARGSTSAAGASGSSYSPISLQRLVAGVDELDAADDDAPERVLARDLEADLGGDLPRERREPVGAERVAGERAAEVRASVRTARVERVRARDVLLVEVLVVLADGNVEPTVGDDPAVFDRVRRPARRGRRARSPRRARETRSRPSSERSRARPHVPARVARRAPGAPGASARGRSRRPSRSPDGSRGRR